MTLVDRSSRSWAFSVDPETAELLSEQAAIAAWLDVECALAAAQASLGMVSLAAVEQVEARSNEIRVDQAALHEGTRVVGYPIVPLLNQMESEAPEVAAAIHWGATTQDIMDSGWRWFFDVPSRGSRCS